MPANSAASDIPVIEIHQTQLKLENLDTNKSVYPGDIPTKLIVKCAHYLSVPLIAIFTQCFVDGIFQCVLSELLYHLYRKTRPQKFPPPPDLRPISKTSIFSKIFESFIYNSSLTIFEIKLTQFSLALGRIVAPRIVYVIYLTLFSSILS